MIHKRACLSTFHHTIPTFKDAQKENFENIAGKGENAGTQHFLLFPQCFLLFPTQSIIFESHLFLSSAKSFIFDDLEFFRLVKS